MINEKYACLTAVREPQISLIFKEIVLEIKAEGGKASIKKMGVFTFTKYLTQHIPDKYFRVVRSYGLFSNRLKGKLLAKARMLLNQPVQKENAH